MKEDSLRRNSIGSRIKTSNNLNSQSKLRLSKDELNNLELRISDDISRRNLSRCSILLLSESINKSIEVKPSKNQIGENDSFYNRQMDFEKYKTIKVDSQRRQFSFEKLNKEEQSYDVEEKFISPKKFNAFYNKMQFREDQRKLNTKRIQEQKNFSMTEELKTFFCPHFSPKKLNSNHKISYLEINKRMIKDQVKYVEKKKLNNEVFSKKKKKSNFNSELPQNKLNYAPINKKMFKKIINAEFDYPITKDCSIEKYKRRNDNQILKINNEEILKKRNNSLEIEYININKIKEDNNQLSAQSRYIGYENLIQASLGDSKLNVNENLYKTSNNNIQIVDHLN